MLQDIFWAALEWTAEYKNWGWNAATISVTMIGFFTITESYGILEQNKKIRQDKRGDSVSNILFLYTTSFFLMSGVWGWHLHSIVIVVNAAVTGLVQIPVLMALWKYKDFSVREKVLGVVFAAMPLWMLITPYKSESYLILMFGIWFAFADQFWELWSAGKTGELSIKLLLMYLVASVAWTTYAFTSTDPYFQISQAVLLILLIAITMLWCVWWWRERRARDNLMQKDPA